ncbi:hypothetical protein WG66_014581 [Moniliophthora roreri]|nr:hypothetical protein WG66_014581 [Moniliophthora roreri]
MIQQKGRQGDDLRVIWLSPRIDLELLPFLLTKAILERVRGSGCGGWGSTLRQWQGLTIRCGGRARLKFPCPT